MTEALVATTMAKVLLPSLARRLPDLLHGPKAERELSKCLDHAVRGTVEELELSRQSRELLSMILTGAFTGPQAAVSAEVWTPSDGSISVLISNQIARRLAVFDDAELTGVDVSSFQLLDVDSASVGAALARHLLNAVVLHGIRPDSPLRVLAEIIRDEARHSELLDVMGDLRSELGLLSSRNEVRGTGAVSLVDRSLVVPDGANSVDVRLAVTNTSKSQQRLVRLFITVAESQPSEVMRLCLPGAPLSEYDLAADLREVSAVDTLQGAPHQFILPPGASEAFRIALTVKEGMRYKLVVHPEFESIPDREISSGEVDHLTVEFPLQSMESLRRAGLA
ncbi:hypothetical protein ACFYZI_41040 [Streptomyces griseorubiginosus]|uniref:hypothetical protein n=1 Tax=Streptomyces griseorubiginosus TaxID=67304 RepID=UPI0036C81CA9